MTGTVDYSWSHPPGGYGAITDAGYVGAERYLGNDGRCITTNEVDGLLAVGAGIGLIWETTADRSATGGYWGGYDDGQAANHYADALAAPGHIPIRYATDFHAAQWQIDGPIFDYYAGVRDAGGRPPRVYGGAPVIDMTVYRLGYGPGWQAAAASWSNYELSPNAALLQEVAQIWGGGADTNVVLCPDNEIDWLWGRSGGDWFDMATEEDLRRVVTDVCNDILARMYTGQRAVAAAGDGRSFEVVRDPNATDPEEALLRRYIPRPAQTKLLRYIDGIAEADWTGDSRQITDPEMVEEFNRLPIIGMATAE